MHPLRGDDYLILPFEILVPTCQLVEDPVQRGNMTFMSGLLTFYPFLILEDLIPICQQDVDAFFGILFPLALYLIPYTFYLKFVCPD